MLTGALPLSPLTVTAVGIAADQRASSATATIRSPEAPDEPVACIQGYEAHYEEGGSTPAFAIARGAMLTQDDGTALAIAKRYPMPLAGDARWLRTGTWSAAIDGLEPYPDAAPRPPVQWGSCGDTVTLYGSTDRGVFTSQHAPLGAAGRVAVGLLPPCVVCAFVRLRRLLRGFLGALEGSGPVSAG